MQIVFCYARQINVLFIYLSIYLSIYGRPFLQSDWILYPLKKSIPVDKQSVVSEKSRNLEVLYINMTPNYFR